MIEMATEKTEIRRLKTVNYNNHLYQKQTEKTEINLLRINMSHTNHLMELKRILFNSALKDSLTNE